MDILSFKICSVREPDHLCVVLPYEAMAISNSSTGIFYNLTPPHLIGLLAAECMKDFILSVKLIQW